jgi:hypothetical protein
MNRPQTGSLSERRTGLLSERRLQFAETADDRDRDRRRRLTIAETDPAPFCSTEPLASSRGRRQPEIRRDRVFGKHNWRHSLLFISERSRLPVLLPVRQADRLRSAFPDTVCEMQFDRTTAGA